MPATQARPSSQRLPTHLRDFKRRMKSHWKWERTGGGHYRLRDSSGELVQYRGKNLTSTSSPSPGVVQALERQLTEVGAFKGTARPEQPLVRDIRKQALQRATEIRQQKRQEEAQRLYERLGKVIDRVGGWNLPGMQADLSYVGHKIAREQGKEGMAPDLLQPSIHRVAHQSWVEPRYQEVWHGVAEKLEQSPDIPGTWFGLVREARGLPTDVVHLDQPRDAQTEEWPFRVVLLPLDSLLIEEAYQRPVNWPFVRKEAARFDPALVGTIDVAQRSPSRYAILDGQQRAEICRMIGKSVIWASVYTGLDMASEARFFLKKNRDRKIVHPYYTFRARVTAADEEALAIDRIVRDAGFKLGIGVPGQGGSIIAAIAALEIAYRRKRPDGSEALTPTLAVLQETTSGSPQGQAGGIIRGLSGLFERFADDEISRPTLLEVMGMIGPQMLMARARHLARTGGTRNLETGIIWTLVTEHNRLVGKAGPRLKVPKDLGSQNGSA